MQELSGSSCIGNPIAEHQSGKWSTTNSPRTSFYWLTTSIYTNRSYGCETAFRCAESFRMEPNQSHVYLNCYSNFTILNGDDPWFGCPALASRVSVHEPMESRNGPLHITFGLGQRPTVSRLRAQDLSEEDLEESSVTHCCSDHGRK